MNYEVDGDKYQDLEEVILCIRAEVRKAKRENKTTFVVDTNSF